MDTEAHSRWPTVRERRLSRPLFTPEHFDRIDAGRGDGWGNAGEADDRDHQQGSDAVRHRISARDPKQLTLDEASAGPRERQASGQAHAQDERGPAQDELHDARRGGADRQANAELATPLDNGLSDQAVQSDRREHEANRPQQTEHPGEESLLTELPVDARREGRLGRERNRRIESARGFSRELKRLSRPERRPHDEVGVLDDRERGERFIEQRVGRTLDAPEVGVAGDPDHIERDCFARAGLRQDFASDRLV